MPKPDVLLYDDVQKWTTLRPKDATRFPVKSNAPLIEQHLRNYRGLLRRAQRFYLTDDFAEKSMAASHDLPKVQQWSNLARLPYGVTWFEFDCKAKVRASVAAGALSPSKVTMDDVPNRMGFLFQTIDEQTGVWAMTIFSDAMGVPEDVGAHPVTYLYAPEAASPLILNLPKPWRASGPVYEVCKKERFRLSDKNDNVLYSGVTSTSIEEQWRGMAAAILGINSHPGDAFLAGFQDRVTVVPEFMFRAVSESLRTSNEDAEHQQLNLMRAIFFNALKEETGMLRWAIAILAMMAAAPVVKHYFPASSDQRMFRGKHLPYLDHNVITLSLPKENAVPLIHRALMKSVKERQRNRAHMVRGHFCAVEYGKEIPFKCRHENTIVENGIGVCLKCERKVRWKQEHARGDASRGWVNHDYVVEAQKGKMRL